ncbi:sulfotransferase 1C2-like [Ptychodera flava]|uniref:sulfotransferase 1C2-like n=1 Tax=Ptychodera flava TaxID=63121 RepID=UPI00396AA86A
MNSSGIADYSPYNEEYGCNIFLHEGFPLPPGMTVKRVKELMEFEVRHDDVFIVGYPKSGTNWMQIAVAKMSDSWGTCKITDNGRVPVLELPSRPSLEGFEKCVDAPSPRLIKSHLPLKYFPPKRAETKCKVIYIARNPKDVCVSWFNMNKAFAPINFSLTFAEYVERFVQGKVFYSSYVDHVCDWRDLGLDDNVLHVTYEEMKADVVSVLRKITKFIGKSESNEEVAKIAESISFEKIKGSREQFNAATLDEKVSPFLRKGIIGDWKNHLTVAQNELFDKEIVEKLKQKDVNMIFE